MFLNWDIEPSKTAFFEGWGSYVSFLLCESDEVIINPYTPCTPEFESWILGVEQAKLDFC